jgi:hypothetical protein
MPRPETCILKFLMTVNSFTFWCAVSLLILGLAVAGYGWLMGSAPALTIGVALMLPGLMAVAVLLAILILAGVLNLVGFIYATTKRKR